MWLGFVVVQRLRRQPSANPSNSRFGAFTIVMEGGVECRTDRDSMCVTKLLALGAQMDGICVDGCHAVSSQSTHHRVLHYAHVQAMPCLVLFTLFCCQVRLHSLEHAGMFISGPDGPEMTRLVEVSET